MSRSEDLATLRSQLAATVLAGHVAYGADYSATRALAIADRLLVETGRMMHLGEEKDAPGVGVCDEIQGVLHQLFDACKEPKQHRDFDTTDAINFIIGRLDVVRQVLVNSARRSPCDGGSDAARVVKEPQEPRTT